VSHDNIPSAIARLGALVEFLAGVSFSEDEEHAAAQDARIVQARGARADIEAAIAAAYQHDLEELGDPTKYPAGRALARTRRMMFEAGLSLVSMRLESAIIEWSHAYTKAITQAVP
jgi:hypothetical protein